MTARAFFNRDNELAEVGRVIEAAGSAEPLWLAIVGHRKVGKTSLLLEAARRAKQQPVEVVVIDAEEVHPPSIEFFRRYALRALDSLLGVEAGISFEQLAARPDEYRSAVVSSDLFAKLQKTTRASVSNLASMAPGDALLREALELPERLAKDLSRRIVMAIDEFQELASLRGPRKSSDPLPVMRSIWQRHENVGYVISGSARTMLLDLVTSKNSPFFQHFALLELPLFSEDKALELLMQAAPADRKISREIAARAFELLGGHPFYLQLFGEALTANSGPYEDAAFKHAMQNLLFSRTGRLALYFEAEFERTVGRSTTLAAVLDALAESNKLLSEIARTIGATAGATAHYIERLGDAIERRADQNYALTDPAFGHWLRWRRPGGAAVPMVLVGDEAERRVAEYLSSLGFDLVYQSRGSRGAFDLLATHGPEQLGIQVKRSDPPLRFTKVEWARMSAEAKRFGWRWAVMAVAADGAVVALDPKKARQGREIRLSSAAIIENLLEWLLQ